MKLPLPFSFIFLLAVPLAQSYAQTGPGGVGTSTDLVLWLEPGYKIYSDNGSTPVVNNDKIYRWDDRSENNKNALQSTLNKRPEFIDNQLNGYPVVRFTTNSQLISQSLDWDNKASSFIVASYSSLPSSNPGLLQGSSPGNASANAPEQKSIGVWVSSSNKKLWGRGIQSNGTTNNLPQNFTTTANTFYSISTIWGQDINQYVNNQFAGNNTSHNGTLRDWTDVSIGQQAGSESWAGDIAEVIVYNIAINNTQRIIIDNYLAAKYNLTLPGNDLYSMDNPANGNFDFDVAGIGRMSSSDFHDDAKGDRVRIRNAQNLTPGKFLFWGHNGLPDQGNETTDVPAGVQARMERVWRVSEVDDNNMSADVGKIDMLFDLNGLGSITTSELVLLIDSDNNGVFQDEVPIGGAVDLGGGIYAFNEIGNIANGRRFTIGTINKINTPLPLSLKYFSVQENDKHQALITWETETEQNNSYFSIERSKDAIRWEEVQQVPGKGSVAVSSYYTYTDENPFSGVSYYRLTQTDIDQKTSILGVKPLEIPIRILSVFPNPATNVLRIEGDNISRKSIDIFDFSGKKLTGLIDLISSSSGKLELNIGKLPAGVYLLRTDKRVITFSKK